MIILKHLVAFTHAHILTRIISPNLMAIVVCTAIANGGDAEWNFAYERYLDSNLASEKEILLYAVSCTRNQPTLIK